MHVNFLRCIYFICSWKYKLSQQADETTIKALEREIALQQLSELPHQVPKQRIYRGKQTRSSANSSGSVLKEKPLVQPPIKDKNKENSTASKSPALKKDSIDLTVKKQPIEIEPQVKVNMVLKTYSRKRKISEPQEPEKESPPMKKPVSDSAIKDTVEKMDTTSQSAQLFSPVYMTKSSRVIKKKVIWDPDDPARSPRPISSPLPTKVTAVVVKTVKADKNSNTEKVIERKLTPSSSEKKVVEKPVTEKKVDKMSPKKSISPKVGSVTPKPKKIRSEIDKLLMDEGKEYFTTFFLFILLFKLNLEFHVKFYIFISSETLVLITKNLR